MSPVSGGWQQSFPPSFKTSKFLMSLYGADILWINSIKDNGPSAKLDQFLLMETIGVGLIWLKVGPLYEKQ